MTSKFNAIQDMHLFDVPMIKNHSYMMYLKNVSYPHRLSDLNWIFTKINILLFFANFLTKFLKDLLTKQAKIVIFSISEAIFESVRVVTTL